MSSAQAKRLIRLFGFIHHDAPGEGEAECALVQKHGIVDAVLSEDVDTIMFGCTKTLKKWSSESKTVKTPTHVSLYDVEAMGLAARGLDREGMVLVAMMSGGDYLPDGIPSCGVKTACEAAKAGFGKSLCRLKTSDKVGIKRWKESLVRELSTNESNYFRCKQKALALAIPEDFPNMEVLRFYTHPVVSPVSALEDLRQRLENNKEDLQLECLREYTKEVFGWEFRTEAIKFIRVLGPALLTQKLQHQKAQDLVKRVTGRRAHFSTDAEPELRLAYIPANVVPIDLSKEVEENIASARDGLALNSDEEFEAEANDVSSSQPTKTFDMSKPELAWVIEAFAKRTLSNAVLSKWEAAEQAKLLKSPKKKATTTRTTRATKASKSGMPQGALDGFVKVTKTTASAMAFNDTKPSNKKTIPLDASPKKSSQQPSRIFRPSSPPFREQSKLPISSNPTMTNDLWTDSSQVSTRTPHNARRPEAIIIPSSPVAASSPSPPSSSPKFRMRSPRVAKVSDALRSDPTESQIAKGANTITKFTKDKTTKTTKTRSSNEQAIQNSAALSSRPLKQTSIKMFTTLVEEGPGSSQHSTAERREASPENVPNIWESLDPSQQLSTQCSEKSSTEPNRTRFLVKRLPVTRSISPISRAKSPARPKLPNCLEADPWDDSGDDGLPPASSFFLKTQSSPKSPGKRLKSSPASGREASPTRTGKNVKKGKKKLLVSRKSAVGYFKEIEVNTNERDEIASMEAKRGQKAIRMSDVSFIDLTQDDQ